MKIRCITLVVFLTLCYIVTSASAGWRIETVDSAENVGKFTSLALDSAGYPHISYYNDTYGDLMYVRWTGSAWAIEVVDHSNDVGQFTSIAVNTVGYPFPSISYYDNTTHSLKYAKRVVGISPWDIEIVDAIYEGDVGKYNSLALDDTGDPHISYYDATNRKLMYIFKDGVDWSFPDPVGPSAGGDWGKDSSLALDGTGHPHISFYDSINHVLKYAKNTGTSWNIQTVDDDGNLGESTSIALDSSGNPRISYFDDDNDNLKYAKLTESGWQTESVNSFSDGGTHSSMVLDGSDHPHISYYDFMIGALGYTKWTGYSWQAETVDGSDIAWVGKFSSLALDGSGRPHISYYDSTRGHLMYAKYVPSCIGVFRPSTHMFFTDYNGNGQWDGAVTDRQYNFGLIDDIPLSGDWDNQGPIEIGVFRPSTHMFYLDYNGNGRWDGAGTDRAYTFGLTGDRPVARDWDRDGMYEIGVFRPSTHTFYLDYNGNGAWDGAVMDRAYNFGLSEDQPVAGDWDEDGRANIGVYRPSTHTFYLDYNGNGSWDGAVTDRAYNFGLTGDLPLSGDWNGNMIDKFGVYRPSTHTFYLDYNGNGRWDGAVTDRAYNFGLTGDLPVSGD